MMASITCVTCACPSVTLLGGCSESLLLGMTHETAGRWFERTSEKNRLASMPGHSVVGGIPSQSAGQLASEVQLDGSLGLMQVADHPDTMYRCDGRLQLSTDSNMWSWRT